jgi:sec-independent protein translocase protein TatB
MLDISWSEMMIVAVAALIFLGPRDIPVLMRTLGRYWGWGRSQIGAFRSQLDTAVREADLDLVRKELEALQKGTKRDVL